MHPGASQREPWAYTEYKTTHLDLDFSRSVEAGVHMCKHTFKHMHVHTHMYACMHMSTCTLETWNPALLTSHTSCP